MCKALLVRVVMKSSMIEGFDGRGKAACTQTVSREIKNSPR